MKEEMFSMKEGCVMVQKRAKRVQPLSRKQVLDIGATLTKAATERKEKERRQQESVTLVVGKHAGCGGKIEYHSSFVLAVPFSEVRFGGKNPMKEEVRCSCTKCGQAFDAYFEPYRKQVEQHRCGK